MVIEMLGKKFEVSEDGFMNPSGKESGDAEGINGGLLERGHRVRGLGNKSEFVGGGRREFLASGERLERRMAGPVIRGTMRMGARSVSRGTFVLMSRGLEVKVFCVWGAVMSQCKLSRKEDMKGSGWIGNVGGTKM